MGKKLSGIANNIIWIVIVVVFTAISAASLYYWAPWQSSRSPGSPKFVTGHDVGSITIACKGEPDSLNPYSSQSVAAAQLTGVLYSGLTAFDGSGNTVPDLSLNVPALADGSVSADGKTVTYHLRSDVVWSDGQAFGAVDVVATWKYIMNCKNARHEGYDQIAAIDTPAPQTVVMHFKQYYPEYLVLFPAILPAHKLAEGAAALERNPAGTGPYKIKEWLLGDSLVLEANDSYYAGKPKIAKMKVRFINEDKILQAQLKAGELDLVADIDLQQYDNIKDINNYELKAEPTLELERLDFNCADAVLAAAKVRRALALTVDKKHICEDLLSGVALQTTTFVLPLSPVYNPDISERKDLQAALALLKDEGWQAGVDGIMTKSGKRLNLELLVNGEDIRRMVIADNIAAGFREAGVETVVVKAVGKDFSLKLKSGKFQIALYGMMMFPDFSPALLWSSRMIPEAVNGYFGMNFTRFKDPKIDKLLADGGLVLDKNNMLLLQRYLYQEMPALPLFYRKSLVALRKGLNGYAPGITTTGNYRNAHLWQWE